MIVLDTNVASHLMGNDPPAVAWLSRQPPHDIFMTTVTRAEIRFGIACLPRGRRRDSLAAAADVLFESMADRVLSFDNQAADEYGALLAARLAAGRPMGHEDAQIAAVARSRRAVLATRNVKDFEDCGLAIVNPWA